MAGANLGSVFVAQAREPEGLADPEATPTLAVLNALRRAALADVPVRCLGAVQVLENTSLLPDEMVATRARLLPLRADAPVGQEVALDVAAPADAPRDACARDLEPAGLVACDGGVQLTRLKRGERVRLLARVREGTAREHACFAAAAAVALRHAGAGRYELELESCCGAHARDVLAAAAAALDRRLLATLRSVEDGAAEHAFCEEDGVHTFAFRDAAAGGAEFGVANMLQQELLLLPELAAFAGYTELHPLTKAIEFKLALPEGGAAAGPGAARSAMVAGLAAARRRLLGVGALLGCVS